MRGILSASAERWDDPLGEDDRFFLKPGAYQTKGEPSKALPADVTIAGSLLTAARMGAKSAFPFYATLCAS